jgi:hypothetical protein
MTSQLFEVKISEVPGSKVQGFKVALVSFSIRLAAFQASDGA